MITFALKKFLEFMSVHTTRYVWIFDNGHGARTPDRKSPTLPDSRVFYEYEFNRAIVERLITRCTAAGIAYFDLVPDSADVGNFVMGRVARANRKSYVRTPIYISIHADAAPRNLTDAQGWAQANIKGTTAFYESNQGGRIANKFVQNLGADNVFRNRGFRRRLNDKGEQYYYVLRETKMVAVILELGFFNNQEEVVNLLDENFRDLIADSLFRTIQEIEANGI